MDDRWHVALDTGSVRALERAFESSKYDDELDELILYCARRGSSHLAEFGWQLIGISS